MSGDPELLLGPRVGLGFFKLLITSLQGNNSLQKRDKTQEKDRKEENKKWLIQKDGK